MRIYLALQGTRFQGPKNFSDLVWPINDNEEPAQVFQKNISRPKSADPAHYEVVL